MADLLHEGSAASPRRARRRGRVFALALIGALTAGLAVGFIGFARSVTHTAPPADPQADAIVVLTGGAARIDGALHLLAQGRAERLLISGVNPQVTREALAATAPGQLRWIFECCVDLDHARDTIENASFTRGWVEERGVRRLIVVTSDYHMPRSMAELAEAMPGVELIAYPVSNPELRLGDWWRDANAFSLLASEYGKFLLVEARRLLPNARAANASAASL